MNVLLTLAQAIGGMIAGLRNVVARKLIPRMFLNWSDPDVLARKRETLEKNRQQEGRPHEVLYFHEISDPYSHLTAQLLDKFTKEYEVELVPLVVGNPPSETVHEPSLYKKYCLTDAIRIAPFYGTVFPNSRLPSDELISLAQRILCNLESNEFVPCVAEVSAHVWSGNEAALKSLVNEKTPDTKKTSLLISNNEDRRTSVEAFMGSTFSYEGELYWGVDRLDHLENRLKALGLKKNSESSYISERIKSEGTRIPTESNIKLEFYPSLNSPYTSISLEKIKDLESDYPIEIITKPVLPMLMRNMSIPNYKVKYIIKDSAREARKHGIPFGKMLSPLGKPAERAYSLFPWIDEQGQGFEYICRLMLSSFRKAEDIGKISYLRTLVEDLGLDWKVAEKHLDTDQWHKVLEENRLTMYKGNSWGVPSFRIVDGEDTFTTWGQDRIWLVEEEIIKRLKKLNE